MTMVSEPINASNPMGAYVEALMGQRGGRISERSIYYRKGPKGPEANWIVVSGSNQERMLHAITVKGWTPLPQYGEVGHKRRSSDPDGAFERYGVWGEILTRPGGAAEFPLSQILAFRWYDPERCPVPNVRFPQLEGADITEYVCPICESADTIFHEARHLGRHLFVHHHMDRTEIIAIGKELGVDFHRVVGEERGRGKRTVTPVIPEEPVNAADDAPQFSINRRRPGRPSREESFA